MKPITAAKRMQTIHSDIRGPLFIEAMNMQKAGRDVLKLNTGNPAAFGFEMPASVKAALQGFEGKALGYCDFMGMPEARRAIADYHRANGITDVREEDVFIGNGVSEVATFSLLPLLDPGDEVLLPLPCYSLWSNTVRLAGAVGVFYRCDESDGWNPDTDDIEKKITERTRAILIINPNNPTGAVYSLEVLSRIAEIARKHGLIVLSDEIYDRLILGEKKHIPIASIAPDIPVITFNGLSKSHFLCGFRCGWMITSGPRGAWDEYREGVIKLTSMRLCANAPVQTVIPAALSDGKTPRSVSAPGGRLYEQSLAAAEELSKIEGVSFVKNDAAFYIFVKLDKERFGLKSDKRFAADLLRSKGILVVPGSGFDYPEPDHFRIVLLPEAEILRRAIFEIGDFLKDYKQS